MSWKIIFQNGKQRAQINSLSDKRSIWDWLKYKFRNHAISYSKQNAIERNARENENWPQ